MSSMGDALNAEAVELLNREEWDAGERLLRQAVEAGSLEAAFNLACLIEDDEPEEAVALYRVAAEGGRPGAYLNLGNVLTDELGRAEEGEAAYRAAIEHGEVRGYGNLGLHFVSLGRYADAEEQFRASIAAGQPEDHWSLGNVLRDTGRVDEAVEHYEIAIEQGVPDAYGSLADVLLERGEVERAAQVAEEGVGQGDEFCHFALARAYRAMGDVAAAERVYAAGVAVGVDELAREYGDFLAGQPSRADDAEAAYRTAIDQGDSDAWNELAIFLQDQGDVTGAADAFRRGAELGDELAARNLAEWQAEEDAER